MDITSKASIIVTANLSSAETVASVLRLAGFEAAVLDAAQAEAVKDATDLKFVSHGVVVAADGSATVEMVYEKVDVAAPVTAAIQAEPTLQPAGDAPLAAVLPLSLQTSGAPPAGA